MLKQFKFPDHLLSNIRLPFLTSKEFSGIEFIAIACSSLYAVKNEFWSEVHYTICSNVPTPKHFSGLLTTHSVKFPWHLHLTSFSNLCKFFWYRIHCHCLQFTLSRLYIYTWKGVKYTVLKRPQFIFQIFLFPFHLSDTQTALETARHMVYILLLTLMSRLLTDLTRDTKY